MQDAKTASVHVRLCSLVRWRQQECNYVYGGHLRPFDALALHGVCVALRGGGRAGAEQVGEVKSVERRFGKKEEHRRAPAPSHAPAASVGREYEDESADRRKSYAT